MLMRATDPAIAVVVTVEIVEVVTVEIIMNNNSLVTFLRTKINGFYETTAMINRTF